MSPDSAAVFNPAFDVTPNRYVAGVIRERRVDARATPRVAEAAGGKSAGLRL